MAKRSPNQPSRTPTIPVKAYAVIPQEPETSQVLDKPKPGQLGTRTRNLVTAQVNTMLLKIVAAFGAVNVMALASIWYVAVNTASDAAKTIARETATDAFNNVAKSQKISEASNERAMMVFQNASETFGRVTVLKEMLDKIEAENIAKLSGSVRLAENKLKAIALLLDETEADKRIQLLKAAELFKGGDAILEVNNRLNSVTSEIHTIKWKHDLLSKHIPEAYIKSSQGPNIATVGMLLDMWQRLAPKGIDSPAFVNDPSLAH